MHDRIGIEIRKDPTDSRTIADIGEEEVIARMAMDRSERGKIPRIGQLVDDEYLMIGVTMRYLTSADPMNPAPPVTIIFMYESFGIYPRSRSGNGTSGWPS